MTRYVATVSGAGVHAIKDDDFRSNEHKQRGPKPPKVKRLFYAP